MERVVALIPLRLLVVSLNSCEATHLTLFSLSSSHFTDLLYKEVILKMFSHTYEGRLEPETTGK